MMYCAPDGVLWMNATTSNKVIAPEWYVAPDNITTDCNRYTCPSYSGTLGTFAVTNIVVGILGLLAAARPVVSKLSGGRLGKSKPFVKIRVGKSGPVMIPWGTLFPLALQLLANTFAALTMKLTLGYGHISLGHAFLLYFLRPRSSWLLASLLSTVKHRGKFVWRNACISSAIAESFLQIGAAAFVFVCWGTGKAYAGAGWTGWLIITIPAGAVTQIAAAYGLVVIVGRADEEEEEEEVTGMQMKTCGVVALTVLCGGWSYLFSWLFFACWISIAGHL
jgi:hypothetical protein